MMKSAYNEMRMFIQLFIIWLVAISCLLILSDKAALHLSINQLHHPLLDVVFQYLTHLGDGIFGAVIVLIGFIYRLRYGVIGLIGLAGSGLLTQLLKRQVFNGEKRPSKVFENLADFHLVDGVELHSNFSFPSGHATAAFSTFLFLAMIFKTKTMQMICFLVAVVVAFSRVYISQHFMEDIFAGSVIGTGITFIAFALLKDQAWGEKGLVERFDINRSEA